MLGDIFIRSCGWRTPLAKLQVNLSCLVLSCSAVKRYDALAALGAAGLVDIQKLAKWIGNRNLLPMRTCNLIFGGLLLNTSIVKGVITTQHSTAQHSTAQHSTAQHSTRQYSTTQHNITQYSTAQHNTKTQHNAAQHNTTQHNTTTQYSTAHHNKRARHGLFLFFSLFFFFLRLSLSFPLSFSIYLFLPYSLFLSRLIFVCLGL